MKNKWLKYLRRTLAVFIGGIILLFFLDITSVLPNSLHVFMHIQVVPAIMAGSIGILLALFVLTLLLGRIYCSVICPLGIMQDVILRIKKWWYTMRKNKKRLATRYSKPLNVLRYSILALCAVFFAAGIALPLALLDPYSTFGRIATSLLRPAVIWLNNIGADLLNSMENYSLYRITVEHTTSIVLISSIVVLVAIIAAVWRRERIICNSVCPVGSLLGIISRYSLMRITLNTKCTGCKQCERSCKSRCIDTENMHVDASRCVACFDCLDKCKKDAISYAPKGWKVETKAKPEEKFALTASGMARRNFIKGSAVVIGSVITSRLMAGIPQGPDMEELPGDGKTGDNSDGYYTKEAHLPMPPGAVSRERFLSKCTACQLCITRCPTKVLQPAFLEHGLTGMMMPVMKFRVESFCNYECKECTEVCPNGAILPITLEEKKLTRVGNVKFFQKHCVVDELHQDCGACAEHCPTQAVHMVPFGDTGLTIPEITPDLCIGCGGCESICPQVPAAIRIEGVTTQVNATPPTVDVIKEVEITDFGF